MQIIHDVKSVTKLTYNENSGGAKKCSRNWLTVDSPAYGPTKCVIP